jgi:regulatory protein
MPSERGERTRRTGTRSGRDGRDGDRAGADADPEAVARQICLRLLSAAPRTQAQLAAALRRRGVPDDAAAAVLERFAEVKLIDDEMFARAWGVAPLAPNSDSAAWPQATSRPRSVS